MSRSGSLALIVPLAPGDTIDPGLMTLLGDAALRHEVIVATAGDDAPVLPDSIRRVSGTPGRGRQLNRAAKRTSTSWLWFVHADCRPVGNALTGVEQFIACGQDALGYCALRFLHDGPRLAALNAYGANIRSRLLGMPYGDQGFCLRRAWFDRLDGFREDLVRGEDLDLVVRARRAGLPLRVMAATLATSARRYREHGWLKTTVHHQVAAWRLVRDARRWSPPEAK